jgi:hypothetical protein
VLRRSLVAASAAAGLVIGCGQAALEHQPPAPALSPVPHTEFVGLTLEDGSGPESTRLRAARAEYRTRRGGAGFITYHDLTELEFTGAELVLDSASPLPFAEYVGRLYRAVGVVEGQAAAVREDKKTLTQVLFKDLSITQTSQAATLVLSVGRARLALDSGTLIFEGGMTISTNSGPSFEAPHAVLSRDYNAMFARGGRWRGGRRAGRSVYLVVDDAGRLSTTGGMFEPTYADAVERRERMVLEHLLKRAPTALKPLIFALLQSGHSGPL